MIHDMRELGHLVLRAADAAKRSLGRAFDAWVLIVTKDILDLAAGKGE